MATYTITQKDYLEAAQLFHWATKEHYILWFTGGAKRHSKTNEMLRTLVSRNEANKKGGIFAVKYGRTLVYACPRRVRDPNHILKIDHGLGCTEGLVRFWWSKMEGEIIQERYFYGCGCVPEWGIRYSNRKMLLFEFSTEKDFKFCNKIKNKLAAYRKYLQEINKKFNADSIIVFVLDVPRVKVKEFVDKVKPTGLPVFFTDYRTFKEVPITKQLTTGIYIWGEDGERYPLENGH